MKNISRLNKNLERRQVKRHARPPRGMVYPDINSLFDPTDLPDLTADVEYEYDLEADTGAEVSEAIRRIKEERAYLREQWRIFTDTEYWLAICFQTRAQKDEFLQKKGWHVDGDKYLNGLKIAEIMGIDIEPIFLERLPLRRLSNSLRDIPILQPEGGDKT